MTSSPHLLKTSPLQGGKWEKNQQIQDEFFFWLGISYENFPDGRQFPRKIARVRVSQGIQFVGNSFSSVFLTTRVQIDAFLHTGRAGDCVFLRAAVVGIFSLLNFRRNIFFFFFRASFQHRENFRNCLCFSVRSVRLRWEIYNDLPVSLQKQKIKLNFVKFCRLGNS